MRHIFYISLLAALWSCSQSDKIVGHWHINRLKSQDSDYYTLDVTTDTIAYLGKNSINAYSEGEHFQRERRLFFRGGCGSGDFKYKVMGDRIYLENYLGDWIGIRCGDGCCSKTKDLQDEIQLKIDISEITKSSLPKMSKSLDKAAICSVVVGYDKLDSCKFGEIKVELDGEVKKLNDIDEWLTTVRLKNTPSYFKHILSFRIIPDKDIKFSELKPILAILEKREIRKIYLTYLKSDFENQEDIFEYIDARLIDWNNDNSVGGRISFAN